MNFSLIAIGCQPKHLHWQKIFNLVAINLQICQLEIILLEENKVSHPKQECQVSGPREGCGLLYHIDFQGQTFSIRGLAIHNLKESYEQAQQGSPQILEPLRIAQDSQLGEIKIFRTPTYATAEILADQLFNRRFPVHEDSYFNVSDPALVYG